MTLPLTPAMRQYVEIKSRYRDCILFFRMGDFYEMFFEDALRASRLLDIALTSRDKESNIPMCGVPHHARNAYLSKLIRQGCKVAICEQIEEPGQKGIFRREVTEVVTPGLVFSEECLDARGNNFLAAVRFVAPFACAALDATTGAATPWDPNALGGSVKALAVSGGTIYTGGSFNNVGPYGERRLGLAGFADDALIFLDGFEATDARRWSATVPGTP